jgi:formate-dependent nitrite reductase membrane component NrfD
VRRYWPLAVGLAVVVITGLYTGITLGWVSLWNSWAIPGMSIATAVAIASGSALLQMAQQGQRRIKELTAERQSPLSNRIEMLRDNLKVSDAIIAETPLS